MTQQADPRLPHVDTSVDAGTTSPGAPVDGEPTAQPAGWPPTTPETPVAPLSPPDGVGPMPPAAQDPTAQDPTAQDPTAQDRTALDPAPQGPVPPYGSTPYGQAPQGPMPYGTPPYGTPPYGTAPYGTPPYGTAPYGAEPQAPLNTLSWVSVIVAFVVAPVAIVLGIVARKQIARTGERGRGLATLGAILGAVFTLIGIASTVLVLVLATTFSASVDATTTPVPDVTAGAPVPVAPPAGSSPSAAPSSDDVAAGQAQLMSGFMQVGAAADTMSSSLQSHRGDLDAMQGDFSTYRDAIARFRTTATTVTLSPEVRAKVDADLVPAIDRTLADLDTMSTSQSQSALSDAADRLQTDSQAMVTAATAAVGG